VKPCLKNKKKTFLTDKERLHVEMSCRILLEFTYPKWWPLSSDWDFSAVCPASSSANGIEFYRGNLYSELTSFCRKLYMDHIL
jgi:hypothetical protein